MSKRSKIMSRGLALLGLGVLLGLGWWGWSAWRIAGHANRAREAIERGDVAGAQEHLQRWLEARPNSPEAYYLLGKGSFAIGFDEQGFQAMQRAEELGYAAPEIARERGLALARRGRLPEAELLLSQARSAGSDARVESALAKIYASTFQLKRAEEAIDRWVKLDPKDPEPYLLRVELGKRTNATNAEKVADLEAALRLDPEQGKALVELGELKLETHEYARAKELFELRLKKSQEDISARIGLGCALIGLGQESEGIAILEQARIDAPKDIRPLQELAKQDLLNGRFRQALDRLNVAVELDPADPAGHYQRGQALTRLGQVDEAKKALDRADELSRKRDELRDLLPQLYANPDNIDLQYKAAQWLFEVGQPEEGKRWAERILAVEPFHEATNRLLVDFYERTGNPGLANFHRTRIHESETPKK